MKSDCLRVRNTLSPLLRAIKEKRQVALHYYKFWDKNKQPVVRTIEPYLLKEAQKALGMY